MAASMERGFAVFVPELRKRGDTELPTIFGYAAVYDVLSEELGGYREMIKPGAFDEALTEKPDVSARIQHEGGLTTIGRTTNDTLRLGSDKMGLWYEIIPPDTSAGRDIVSLIRDKYITQSSFAFMVREDGEYWVMDSTPPTRILTKLTLYDVAPVDGPAYVQTTVEVRKRILQNAQAAKPPIVDAPNRAKAEQRLRNFHNAQS